MYSIVLYLNEILQRKKFVFVHIQNIESNLKHNFLHTVGSARNELVFLEAAFV